STLSFLGLGVLAPVPSWGAMLNDARGHLFDAPHMVVFPALAMMTAVLSFNLLGDACVIGLIRGRARKWPHRNFPAEPFFACENSDVRSHDGRFLLGQDHRSTATQAQGAGRVRLVHGNLEVSARNDVSDGLPVVAAGKGIHQSGHLMGSHL